MVEAASAVIPSDIVRFFKVLADETRLAIVRLLALTDLRAGELVEMLHTPQNALSYHLKQLRALGLLRDRRSSQDARDVYYSVDIERLDVLYQAVGRALHPALMPAEDGDAHRARAGRPLRMLFLCTHNSARSQLAEGIARYVGGEAVEAYSAGSEPADVHPLALAKLAELGIDTSTLRSKSVEEFRGRQFDYVITVCDRVRDGCPTFFDDPHQIHWSFADPAALEDEQAQRRAFETTCRELTTRLRYLLAGSSARRP